ncbi:hypothetical protein pEaSNUABM13_00057 [Erwinia phage pEa_SNUABM_13]|uniref:Uncharacterized protein n=1 Tax=Erwinia phage pEa_SNUABM_7 TaxID=2866695 RepID=A0AAE7WSU6_9CAUD|nr:hypothetical protein MPK74_gp056 [Erwinia phage pEa_SNUABM_7]QYW03016.1 hypothetical protein pEaSNUABM13_00057 [Erwinia phage pEa_SNUABM_13]QYW03357.1 hypothetical protein pEaSNUABM34_00055 [Erwinia phage pEa_SNUABM_34]QYW05070.1 hypothetical protein pEaSNUABM21_00056 [Erwinia phage pEa_SNUABM_21]QYW05411.1 hypothetical protein pEaSNUABM25_00055 [Erwinia phage pEa_SNUABM_25]QYW04724.1 hypothetical protein pEaSNUABM7_00056 [Erwinia phage pEa_SNUABM_7]
MKIPKKWRTASNSLAHTVEIINDNAQLVVVYKVWYARRKRWEYCAEPIEVVLYIIKDLHFGGSLAELRAIKASRKNSN